MCRTWLTNMCNANAITWRAVHTPIQLEYHLLISGQKKKLTLSQLSHVAFMWGRIDACTCEHSPNASIPCELDCSATPVIWFYWLIMQIDAKYVPWNARCASHLNANFILVLAANGIIISRNGQYKQFGLTPRSSFDMQRPFAFARCWLLLSSSMPK